ncbi:MAG: DNRLRE domain-containing protein [Candidatus Udaeobacter sp.]
MRKSKTLLALILTATLGCTAGRSASAAIINIMPSKDNTLYQYDPNEGDFSNGAGFHFFAGETAMSELRRGVLAFDIAGSIPPGSIITSVTLTLNMSKTFGDTTRIIELHRLVADWGEGTSHAPGEEGDGAPATPNDATWRHRFFDTIFWAMEGGDFSATVSASQSVGPLGFYTWNSVQMVADVQSWVNNPSSNFGWLVLGDESTVGSAKRFDTRESANPPVLTIEYRSGQPTQRPRPTPPPRP